MVILDQILAYLRTNILEKPAHTTNDRVIASDRMDRLCEVKQTDQRQDHCDDPKANDDGGLAPAELFEMVVDRRHLEDALARQLEGRDLDDHRHRLEHEEAADYANICVIVLVVGSIAMAACDRYKKKYLKVTQIFLILAALFSSTVMARTAFLGGQIRHTEVR